MTEEPKPRYIVRAEKGVIACYFHKGWLDEFKRAVHYRERYWFYAPPAAFWQLTPKGFAQLADAHGDRLAPLSLEVLDLIFPPAQPKDAHT